MPTKPGFVQIDLVNSCDGKYCLVINDRRVAGCKPSLSPNNVAHTWNARKADVADALGPYEAHAERARSLETAIREVLPVLKTDARWSHGILAAALAGAVRKEPG